MPSVVQVSIRQLPSGDTEDLWVALGPPKDRHESNPLLEGIRVSPTLVCDVNSHDDTPLSGKKEMTCLSWTAICITSEAFRAKQRSNRKRIPHVQRMRN